MNTKKSRFARSALTALIVLTASGCSVSHLSAGGSQAGTAANTETTPAAPAQTSGAAVTAEVKPEPGASLTLWEEEVEFGFLKPAVKEFEEKYNVPVQIEHVPVPNQAQRLSNDGPAKLAADVVLVPHDRLGDMASANLILPNDVFEQDTRNTMLDTAVQAVTFNGILYGYPKSIETYALYYNKDLVKEPAKTWDQIAEFAKTFNDKSKNRYAVMWENRSMYYNYAFIGTNGGYVFGKNGTDPEDIGLNNDGAVQAMKYFQGLKSILPVNTADTTYNVKTQLFQEGKLAYNIDGPWSSGSFKGKVNFGVMPLPQLPGGKRSVSFSGVRAYYVNSYTKYPNAAKLFAKFLTDKENALNNFKTTGTIPANKEAGEDPIIQYDPIVSGFLEQFKESQPMPSIPEMANVWAPMEGAIGAIWNDQADVKTSLDKAVQTIKDQNKSTKK
ncbi:maltose ABC transporter substrate-binding protein [Paenibacillus chartarius]|uniref:Maltodextrin-binding protein n=1 Tax=Paenibacillus chartarius TaxID=747481 RepID=A0ABV6DTQ8_9BACL